MDLSKSSVFWNKLSCFILNLLNVSLNLNRILPCDSLSIITLLSFRISNNVFKSLGFVKHHWLLAFNHLSSHWIIEVCNLLKSNTFFIKLLSIFSNLNDVFMYFEAHLWEHAGVFHKSYQFVTVINFQKSTSLIVKLH